MKFESSFPWSQQAAIGTDTIRNIFTDPRIQVQILVTRMPILVRLKSSIYSRNLTFDFQRAV
jgi:hypothetical protein